MMRASRTLFRMLMLAYPRTFRARYGEGMSDLFESRMRRAGEEGLGAVVALWASTLWDTVTAATAERFESLTSVLSTLADPRGVLADVRGGARRLLRAPGTSMVTVLLLAVGIAGNVALFTAVNTLLLQAPPGVGEADRAVEVMGFVPGLNATSLTYPEFAGLRDNLSSFESLAAWNAEPMAVAQEGPGRRTFAMYVSDGYFSAMGAHPPRGRDFTRVEAEAEEGAPLVVVSDRYWRTELGGAPDVLGQTLHVNRIPHTVIGVAPANFRGHMGPVGVDVWVPLSMDPDFVARRDLWSTSWIEGVGRLRDGVTLAEARVEANGVFARIREGRQNITDNKSVSVDVLGSVPAEGRTVIGAFMGLLMLFGVLALVVLCANVGGMVLARGMAREREIAVRLALGAGRGRVVRQFLAESLILASLGGAAGVWLAFTGLDIARTSIVPLLPVPVSLTIAGGLPVLLFALVVALGTVMVTGLVPALKLVRDDLVYGLKGDGGGGVSVRTGRLRRLLMGGQVAISTVLLVVSALFLRSLQAAGDVPLGFDAQDIYVTSVNLTAEGYGDPDVGLPRLQSMEAALASLPGVSTVAMATDLPMDLSRSTTTVRREDSTGEEGWVQADQAEVGPGYFDVLGISMIAGRGIEASDVRGSAPVVVVNRALAERYWPGGSALGRQILFATEWHTVVGVADDVLNETVADPVRPTVYGALAQHFRRDVTLIVKARGEVPSLAGDIRRTLLSVDGRLSEAPVRSFQGVSRLGTMPQRIALSVAGAFGLLTVILAAVGLYGTIAIEVGRRTREIGVRMALGAKRGGLVLDVVGNTLRLAAPGVLLGMLAAYGVGRVAGAFLLGIPAGDPVAFVGVAGVLGSVVLVASWVPALVASRVDPSEALRRE